MVPVSRSPFPFYCGSEKLLVSVPRALELFVSLEDGR